MALSAAYLTIAIAFTVMAPLAHATEMPNELIGNYVQETSSCAEITRLHNEMGVWDGIIVSKTGTSFFESSCNLSQATKTAPGTYSLVLNCSGEGENWDANASYKLSGNSLTINTADGSEYFKRCSQ